MDHHPSPIRKSSLWSNITAHLLESIFEKLEFIDVVRCKSVCVSWYSTSKSHIIFRLSRKPHHPLFIFPHSSAIHIANKRTTVCQHYSNFLYSCTNKNFIKLKTQLMGHIWIGSSQRWLIFKNHVTVSLYEPFLGVNMGFVSLRNVESYNVAKAVIWGDPILDINNCIMVAVVKVRVSYPKPISKLAYAKYGDHDFSDLKKGTAPSYCDITCHKNLLYGLTNSVSVEAWDLTAAVPQKVMDIQFSLLENMKFAFSSELYLAVDSTREFLLVVREFRGVFNLAGGGGMQRTATKKFSVGKLDFGGRKVVELGELGDHFLFWVGNQFVSLSTKDFPEFEKNLIYFTDDQKRVMRGCDVGTFNLGDGSIKQCFDNSCSNTLLDFPFPSEDAAARRLCSTMV